MAGDYKFRDFIFCKRRGGGEKMVSCLNVYCEFLGEQSRELTADGSSFVCEVISKIVSVTDASG